MKEEYRGRVRDIERGTDFKGWLFRGLAVSHEDKRISHLNRSMS